MTIYTKLLEVQKQHLAFEKDAKNPFFKSNYVSLDSIVEKLTPILDSQKVLVTHFTESKEIVTQAIDTEDSSMVTSRFPLIESNDPQKLGSCITYAKRYNLGQIFNIITDRDDDGNEASGKEVKVKEVAPTCDKCGTEKLWSENKSKWYCKPCVTAYLATKQS